MTGSLPPSPLHLTGTAPTLTRFQGEVIAVVPSNGPAERLTLQLRNRTVEMSVTANVKYKALSAEATVEGFQVNDYAVVLARHIRRVWVAERIEFDVQPIVRGQESITGTVMRVTANGLHFVLRSETGQLRWVTISTRTKFRIRGQPVDPIFLSRGDIVQVVMRRTSRTWVAVEVNLKARTSFRPSRRSEFLRAAVR